MNQFFTPFFLEIFGKSYFEKAESAVIKPRSNIWYIYKFFVMPIDCAANSDVHILFCECFSTEVDRLLEFSN